ncbi:MAG TPA: HlyD family efflux transporter periplasmic adaptor subunit, partial [Ignavibacteria bacterium]|nr:HlyD family efflux transporter periplasmic adaptor subunit [Ignavibacteria bacterium]
QVIYLNKTTITAPISGYITEVNTVVGNRVAKDELLFKIQTKESKALQNTNEAGTNQFGIIPVFASVSGFINTLNITDANVFITEGNALATIVKNTDLIIQVNAPFEYSKFLNNRKNIEIELPNNEVLHAVFYKSIPLVDPISQTQQVYFKLKSHTTLPENLNVLGTFFIEEKKESILLPKDAVLTNETQDEFWIMRVTSDSFAIKVPVIKGIETDGKIEIVKPLLNISDEIIVTGGYELPDSTKVKMN